uniref:Misexpression suppressor of ras 3 n=2 Tax=Glossina TaxID=7393 RepID=A0A1B0FNN1_GLOMM
MFWIFEVIPVVRWKTITNITASTYSKEQNIKLYSAIQVSQMLATAGRRGMPLMPPRRRLGSVGDSAPPSESSEGTSSLDNNEMIVHPEWSQASQHNATTVNSLFLNSDGDADTLSTDTASNTNLSDYERGQVESFFSGLGTEIYVSSSLANLYEGTGKEGDWHLIFTGIPVILHDKGNVRSRALAKVTLVLAERGSCFALWSDRIDNLSNYRVAGPSFHTMCLSTNHQQVIGFSYDSTESAREIWQQMERLISDPENIALSVPGRKNRKQKRAKPAPLPPKSQISHPCQFHHVTSVTKEDSNRYYSMQAFAPLGQR